MTRAENPSLMTVYQGWDGYQTSLINAIAPLTHEQLRWRPASHLRSVGELARHISLGRVAWFVRMNAPKSAELANQITEWEQDKHGNRYVIENAIAITDNAGDLVRWLANTWEMIDETLESWTVADLTQTYKHTWRNQTYAISRQWTIWRIMAHDIHHGGELAAMLGVQGIAVPELGDMGGHLTESQRAEG